MSQKRLQAIRLRKFHEQCGQCYYCGQRMWHDPAINDVFAAMIGHRRARWFECTAEHLLSRSEGGPISADNIVAACRFCNSRRHHSPVALPPDEYRDRVRARLVKGKWHGIIGLDVRPRYP